ncbi:MAG: NAD-dependent epimerase/dehydratase family protein [Crocinitomicaceae bacterium]|nr:NAD-dependent epimerase/dehydratase family protein [Crocinitomicaceae bacterium]
MRVAVTGASGHLGNVVCRQLIHRGYEVNALYNSDKRGLHGVDVKLFQGSILDEELLKEFLKGCDFLVHCAAIISIHGDPDGRVKKTNIEGVKTVLACAVDAEVKKIIHVSSTHAVMEVPLNEPMEEDRPYKQDNDFAYDHSKAVGEQIMLKAFKNGDIDGCVVRPSCIIGEYDFKPSEMGKALLDLKKGKIPVLPPGGYNFVNVKDVADAMINAIEHGQNGEAYFLTNKYYEIKEIAGFVKEITGRRKPKFRLSFGVMKFLLPFVKFWGKITQSAPVFTTESIMALKNGHPNIINRKAKKDLKLNSSPIKNTIKEFFDWQKAKE